MKRLALVVAVVSALAHADEGMWTFDALPAKQMTAAYGFVPDAKWLEHARLATLQLDVGCTGSFVSNAGLIMTNHHCVEDCLRNLSALKKVNYGAVPFVAKTQAAEAACPDFEIEQLQSTDDVTDKVNAATKGVAAEKFHDALKVINSSLEKACVGADAATIACHVIDLYHGGQYVLFRYKRFVDVRLVFAPEVNAAAFGGDPDNFNFPRFDLDVSFLRAYENGKPVASPNFFAFRPEGAQLGEPLFVLGHPGNTDRLLTVSSLEYQRDFELPEILQDSAFMRGMLHEFASENAHAKEISLALLESIENGIKVRRNEHRALADPRLLARKREEEQALRAAVAKDPALSKIVGDPWSELSALVPKMRVLAPRRRALRLRTPLFETAVDLVRGADQRLKPEAERLPEFADRQLPNYERTMVSAMALYPELEERELAAKLYQMRDLLGTDDPFVKSVLGRKSPESLAREVVKGSKLFDPKVRKALWVGGQVAIAATNDPMISLAKAFESETLALRKRWETEVEGPESRASERVAKAYFAVHKRDTYPDATFTLRLSYGSIKGWVKPDGTKVEPMTTLGGAFDRATGDDPYALPKEWLAAKSKLNLATPYDFVTDHDIVGGNSGSPMVDQQGRVVGLAFDGNLDSIGGNFWFDPTVNRCVAVHPAAILETVKVVYQLPSLASELVPASN